MRLLRSLVLASIATAFACTSSSPSVLDGSAPSEGGSQADANTPKDGGAAVDASPSQDGGAAVDAGTSTDAGTNADAGTSADAGANGDAGTNTDAGTDPDAGALSYPNRIIHLADTAPTIDLCASTSTTFTGTPILRSLGLPPVPTGGVSAPFDPPPDAAGSGHYFRIVDGSSGDCSTSLFDSFGPNLDFGPNKIFVYQGDGSQLTSIGQPQSTAPGMDRVFNLQRQPNRAVNYVEGASTPIPANNFNGALIPAGGLGSIVTSDPPSPDVTRPYRPLAGGLTLLLVYPDRTLACDLLAPPVAGFTVCSTQIRAN